MSRGLNLRPRIKAVVCFSSSLLFCRQSVAFQAACCFVSSLQLFKQPAAILHLVACALQICMSCVVVSRLDHYATHSLIGKHYCILTHNYVSQTWRCSYIFMSVFTLLRNVAMSNSCSSVLIRDQHSDV